MTHSEWEHGENLTICNATKEQLKLMVKDRNATIRRLWEEKEELQKLVDWLSENAEIKTPHLDGRAKEN